MVVLDQGNADHMPGVPFLPVELQYGSDLGTLRFDEGGPNSTAFFQP